MPLDTLQLVGEEEHVLGFWLKMGFEDTAGLTYAQACSRMLTYAHVCSRMGFEDTAGLAANPIKGIWEQALPSTLRDACLPYGVSDEANVRCQCLDFCTSSSKSSKLSTFLPNV